MWINNNRKSTACSCLWSFSNTNPSKVLKTFRDFNNTNNKRTNICKEAPLLLSNESDFYVYTSFFNQINRSFKCLFEKLIIIIIIDNYMRQSSLLRSNLKNYRKTTLTKQILENNNEVVASIKDNRIKQIAISQGLNKIIALPKTY